MKIAAVVHLYYDNLWPELAGYLRNIHQKHTLIVTIPEGSGAAGMVLADFPQARVVPVQNLGRDIAPFVALLPELQTFDLVCKIHTKRDVEGDPSWRRNGMEGVLGTPTLVRRIVWSFRQRQHLMLVGAKVLYLDGATAILGMNPFSDGIARCLRRSMGSSPVRCSGRAPN